MRSLFSRPLPRLLAVVGLQLLILLSIIGFKQYTVWTGETVLLKTQPYDLRDLLRGDYVTVRYDISTIDARTIAGDDDLYGDVYVELRQGADGYWEPVAVHNGREHEFDGTELIKGFAGYSYDGQSTYEIEYGIEEIFIPEGSGDQIPPSTRERPVGVEVKVDRFGNAVPRHFVVDGVPLDLERR
jgi:uncharacterized membrane-anchored protein